MSFYMYLKNELKNNLKFPIRWWKNIENISLSQICEKIDLHKKEKYGYMKENTNINCIP